MSDSEDESSSGMEDDSSTTSKNDREHHSKMTADEQLEAVEPHPNSFVKLTNLRKDFGATPEKQHEPLVELTRPHRDSFDWLINEGLFHIARDLPPMEFQLKSGCRISINFEEIEVNKPTVSADDKAVSKKRKSFAASVTESPPMFPSECRERGITYKGSISASLTWRVNEKLKGVSRRDIGEIPIMLKTKSCNLHGLSPAQLIDKGEEAHEMGGYFIINGIEKVVRMLIMTRRNYPLAMERGRWKSRGPLYTEKGIMFRSVKTDQSSLTNTLHYLSNGNVTIGFTHRKEQFLVPIIMILKSLVNQTDLYIFQRLMQGEDDNSFLRTSVVEMMRSTIKADMVADDPLGDQQQNLAYMGKLFRIRLPELPPWWSNEQVGEYLVSTCILPHLGERRGDKFNLLVHMTRKLFRFVDGKCCAENPDSPMNQEILLPGHLLGMLLKERLVGWLTGLKLNITRMDQTDETVAETFLESSGEGVIMAAARKVSPLTKPFEYLLATGNVVSQTGLGLMQASGFSVVAEKINFYRFLAHFRCVHRGAYFTEMRTTAVRKLLPEAWGFLCPVHTPDGTPCGLLNHLAASCEVVNNDSVVSPLKKYLKQNGLIPCAELTGEKIQRFNAIEDYRSIMERIESGKKKKRIEGSRNG